MPADPSTWIVDFHSVGGVPIGQPIAPIGQAVGLPQVTDTVDCPPGYSGTVGVDDKRFAIDLMESQSRGTAVPDPTLTYGSFRYAPQAVQTAPERVIDTSPSTLAGIRLGSSESELLAAYPGVQKTRSKYDETMKYTTYAVGPSEGRYLVFQVATSASGARNVISLASTGLPYVVDVCD